jgi:hypothetical protein
MSLNKRTEEADMTHSVESKMTGQAGPAAPMAVEHGVPLYLASDEALAHLLNRYPSDLLAINSYDASGDLAPAFGEGDGRALLDAVKAGHIWLVLRGVEQAAPGLWAEAQADMARLAPHIGAENARDMTGQLVLSSPAMRAPCHFHAAGVVLFHLRGVKRVWVYPPTETFLPQRLVEQAVAHARTSQAPWSGNHDRSAWRFDIGPGEAVSWPLYAPHRIEDQEGLSVSLSLDYQTPHSRITTGAHRANAILRHLNLPVLPMANTPRPLRAALWAMSLILGRSRSRFEADPATEAGAEFSRTAAA